MHPLELHLVHTSGRDKKNLAVIAVLFTLTQYPNENLTDIIAAFNELTMKEYENSMNDVKLDDEIENVRKRHKTVYIGLDLMRILPQDSLEHYYYYGSLTTPPCTEGVHWIVLNTKIGISKSQLDVIHSNILKHNNRKTQNINKRVIFTNVLSKCFELEVNCVQLKNINCNYVVIYVYLSILFYFFQK